jgi:hypothetical protein
MAGYTKLARYLLSAPLPNLKLGALIEPTEQQLWAREWELGLDRDSPDFIGELIFTLRIGGCVVLIPDLEVIYGIRNQDT